MKQPTRLLILDGRASNALQESSKLENKLKLYLSKQNNLEKTLILTTVISGLHLMHTPRQSPREKNESLTSIGKLRPKHNFLDFERGPLQRPFQRTVDRGLVSG